MVPAKRDQGIPLLLAKAKYMANIIAAGALIVIETLTLSRGSIDRHRDADFVERYVLKESLHIFEGVNGHPHFAYFSLSPRIIRVEPQLSGQIKGYA